MQPRIFICHSHQDRKTLAELLDYLLPLEFQGVLNLDYDQCIDPGEDFRRWIREAIENCAIGLLLISNGFLRSQFIFEEELPSLIAGSRQSGAVLIPLVIEPCQWQVVPWLERLQAFQDPELGVELPNRGTAGRKRFLNRIAGKLAELCSERAHRRPRAGLPGLEPSVRRGALGGGHSVGGVKRVFLDREVERAELLAAWEDTQVNVFVIYAFGGEGKTALAAQFLDELAKAGYHGAHAVIAYSFDSEDASLDDFYRVVAEALGAEWPEAEPPLVRVERLLRELRRRSVLLVIDALERFMSPRGAADGVIDDPSLERLLLELAAGNPGLCLVTSRILPLQLGSGRTVVTRRLESLPQERAVELLAEHGIRESRPGQIQAVVSRLRGHCLSLNLLASYLRSGHDGRADRADQVLLLADSLGDGVRAILSRYEDWLAGQSECLQILRCVSLFDRSIDLQDLECLTSWSIPGLTDRLVGLDEPQLRLRLAALHDLRLIELRTGAYVDSHPMVREYFYERVASAQAEAFVEANNRIAESCLANLPERPGNRDEVVRAMQAVSHLCRAARYEQAFEDVFVRRVRQNTDRIRNYALRAFALFELDRRCLMEFVTDRDQRRVTDRLPEPVQARILMEIGADLRALGRFSDARSHFDEAYRVAQRCGALALSSETAANSAELAFRRGTLSDAERWARRGVEHADQGGSIRDRVIAKGVLGKVLHALGRLDEAAEEFADAEALEATAHKERASTGVHRFNHLDLLLTLGRSEEVLNRVPVYLAAEQPEDLLMVGLLRLAGGLALLQQQRADSTAAAGWIEAASAELVQASRAEYMPRRALALAALYRAEGKPERGVELIQESLESARLYGMRLAEVDLLIESARLALALGDRSAAERDLGLARERVARSPYPLRTKDLS
jgi:tetratricopeptide (TPR) repeat protein